MAGPIGVRNPRTGMVDYWIEPPERDRLAERCDRLRTAQLDWQAGGLEQRIEALQRWKQSLLARKQKLVQALTADTGRRTESALELDSVISSIDRWCRLAPQLLAEPEPKSSAIPFIRLQQQSVPYALVGVISPWNFPLLLSAIDTIPALLAGCAVVVKPSEIAPRFIKPLSEAIAAVPQLRDVLAYVEGAGDTGAAAIDCVDLVCFTGSVATGRTVAEAATKRFIPAFLELGGKDPAIVLASANLELATSAILWGSTVNTGQSCLSLERIYAADAIFEPFVAMLVQKAKRLQLTYPSVDSGQIGPIIAEKQAATIAAHLDEAAAKGAVVHCGGAIEALGGGLWCRPTVLTQVERSMKVMAEETFGPIMPVMSFSTVEEGVALANDTNYGLSAAVFAGSDAEALEVARRIDAGGISINDAALTAFIYEGEKNAFKGSGLGGSRMGPAAIARFMRKKAFLVKTNSAPDPWWFDLPKATDDMSD
ncbi:aldehyde dehydrogenase family protein [Synechococcus sp. PCC 7336]|uniref:aldehyde dehydrogenase family protein n=1 Tax=Synechococcus sp. PCC 7336 TaxID=195250 RepID=UPI000344C688|nr:aldehyde dehydrogenase family protein [Synechococcus sp. PCC 7336]